MSNRCNRISSSTFATLLVFASGSPLLAQAEGFQSDRAVIYFTRHAEKLTVIREVDDNPGVYEDNCDGTRCEEALNKLGEKRAELLANWFEQRGIAQDITHIFSSDKQRTRQTVEPLAEIVQEYGTVLPDTDEMPDDGIQQLPFAGGQANEPTSNSPSVVPTVNALNELPMGSVTVVAGHSGALYRIFGGPDTDGGTDDAVEGLGIDTTQDPDSFPKNDDDKVKDFGDVWKVVKRPNGKFVFKWRKNLAFKKLVVVNSSPD